MNAVHDIIEVDEPQVKRPAYAVAATTPSALLAMAVEKGADIAQLERLMGLQERWEANEARKAYVVAMAEFKRNPPVILKDKHVGFTNNQGQFVGYSHASLGNVTNTIIDALAAHGISHRWDTKQDAGKVIVTCTLTHSMGHSESTMLEAMPDNSGKKNPIQQIASTVSYLSRYTLLAATGLAVLDDTDDDGAGGPDVKPEIPQDLLKKAHNVSMLGWKALSAWIKDLTESERLILEPVSDDLKSAARAADKVGLKGANHG